jgi:hypothetical protein
MVNLLDKPNLIKDSWQSSTPVKTRQDMLPHEAGSVIGPVFSLMLRVQFSIGAEPLTPAHFNCGRIILALRSACFRSLNEDIHSQIEIHTDARWLAPAGGYCYNLFNRDRFLCETSIYFPDDVSALSAPVKPG